MLGYLGALIAAGALSAQHLLGSHLPGCGVGSACQSISAHPLGSIGGLRVGLAALSSGESLLEVLKGHRVQVEPASAIMPTSLLAAAFFAGLFVACALWLFRGRIIRDGRALRWLARLGAAGSILYLAVIALSGKTCVYCLTAHGFNLYAWLILELTMRKRPHVQTATTSSPAHAPSAPLARFVPLLAGAAVFALCATALGVLDAQKRGTELAKSQAAQRESQAQMVAQAEAARTAAQNAANKPAEPDVPWAATGFTGRWRFGPEAAVVRIVLISDYQCPQCRRIETESFAMQAKYPDKVSISAVQFPLCSACNANIGNQCPHPNACWAARAAETAAIVAGAKAALEGQDQVEASNTAFWKMHRWLFSKGGSFTDATFPADLQSLGFDSAQFVKVMQSPQTLALIQRDIDRAMLLGINGTPMVLINGVELKGWEAPRAVETAVEAIIAANPPAQTAKADMPVLASEKYVADWRDQPARSLPTEQVVHALGDPSAPVEVVVYGDFQEPNTARVDAMIREAVEKNPKGVRYIYRHFPGDKDCNPAVSKTFFAFGCTTSKAAEAAFALGGDEAYWKMHAWLMANQAGMSVDAIKRGAAACGLDADQLVAEMADGKVGIALQEDVQSAASLGVGQIPYVMVNRKFVPRWDRKGDNVMERILSEAGQTKAPPGK